MLEETSYTEIQAELTRRNLSRFLKEAWSVVEPSVPYKHNWHIDYISEYLSAVSLGEISRLLINVAPRSGKSRHVTTSWPAWEWIDCPEYRYLFSSYSSDLARDHSRERRLIIESDWYQERWGDCFQLRGDQNIVTYFANDKGGRMQARGTTGGGTGKGGGRVVVDDPHNVKQSESQVQREQAIRDFDKNLSTRLDDPNTGAIVVVMQRLHYADLSGHLLDDVGGFEHVTLETIATKESVYIYPRSGKQHTREQGDVLFPERQPHNYIEEQKRVLGTAGFESQHQQKPLPEGGNRIKSEWFKRYTTIASARQQCIQSWDTANKPGNTSAYSVCMTFIKADDIWHLVNIYRKQVGYPELRKACIKQFNDYNPDAVLIEDKASGTALIQELKHSYRTIPAISIEPEADKITRMDTQSPHIEAGQISLPEQAHWLSDFEAEVFRFPDPLTFDQIDAFSQFLKYAFGRKREIHIRKLSGL